MLYIVTTLFQKLKCWDNFWCQSALWNDNRKVRRAAWPEACCQIAQEVPEVGYVALQPHQDHALRGKRGEIWDTFWDILSPLKPLLTVNPHGGRPWLKPGGICCPIVDFSNKSPIYGVSFFFSNFSIHFRVFDGIFGTSRSNKLINQIKNLSLYFFTLIM